jgi:thiaminase/transcriptional activator TenA
MGTTTNFTDELWQSVEGIYADILAHPFLKGLADGSLDEEAFRFYVIQDSHYLRDYARGLAILGSKADSDDSLVMFCDHAREAVVVERALHEGFYAHWNLSEEEVWSTEVAPNCLLYTSYLMRVALERPYHEGLAAFLPCYWIYLEVGRELLKTQPSNELYQKWIATYADDHFAGVVEQVKDATNLVAAKLTDEQREAMKRHFVLTSKFEYMFWDMGHQRQQWPV